MNKDEMIQAIKLLGEYFENCTGVETSFGQQNPQKGYKIAEVNVSCFGVIFSVVMLDRSIRENDTTRNGDGVYIMLPSKRENGELVFGNIKQEREDF